MRNLTISRKKSAAASLVRMKVYVEDHALPGLYINGVPCRKIGVLKNGESASFKVPTRAVKIFIVGNKSARNYSNDCYQLDEGYEDITLSGKNVFNPFERNPFRFEENENPQMETLRYKAGVKSSITFTCAVLAFVLLVCALFGGGFSSWFDYDSEEYNRPSWYEDAPEEVFYIDDLSIVLTECFAPINSSGYAAIIDSEKVAIFFVREIFEEYPDFKELTVEEYGRKVIEANKIENTSIKNENGLHYFVFTSVSSQSGDEYTYYGYLFKTEQAFWFVHFAVKSEEADEYSDDVQKWAATIDFKKITE